MTVPRTFSVDWNEYTMYYTSKMLINVHHGVLAEFMKKCMQSAD